VCLFQSVDTISSSITDTSYQFNNHPIGVYYYYVKGYNTTWGWGDYSCLEKVRVEVGIAEKSPEQVTKKFDFTVSPNPFSKLTRISFDIGHRAKGIELKIYDATGRLVRDFSRLTPCALRPTQISWSGTDQTDQKLPNGVYFVKFKVGEYQATRKVLLIR
jgi:hypothetical protein